jgi:Tfp pilus assembly pilus retraction ATPase PilT
MRDAFAHESNGLLISRLLVPDPLSRADWERLHSAWGGSGGEASLLEWIVLGGHLSEEELMGSLAAATGHRALKEFHPVPSSARDHEARVLENNGFIPGLDAQGRQVVAGGPGLPPDLRDYLGKNAAGWEWVVISPLRTPQEQESVEESAARVEESIGSTLAERLESILSEAAANAASDIHFERHGEALRIRMKNKTGMHALGTWKEPACSEALRILKRRANISTAETALPQDGRIEMHGTRKGLSFRASHVTAVNGESLVLRSIGRESVVPRPGRLGIPEDLSIAIRETLLYEHGLVLCTGATGSGKTTTMCSLISTLEGLPLKVLSIEDPVEYEITGATQSAVNPETGWTFPNALKAYLRQDPDIILVGEIRDGESAEMACRAGLTGHCVISSLHARSTTSALDRLQAWGLAPGLLAESVRLVTHQRLVRHPESGRWTGCFNWIRPEPAEIYAYLVERKVPPRWLVDSGTHQDGALASAKA